VTDAETGTQRDTEAPKPDVDVTINEIFYDAAESDTDGHLFVELKGAPGGDISGYQVVFVNGADGKITEQEALPDGAVIGDDGLFVMADAKDGSTAETYVAEWDCLSDFDPQNGPDAVQVFGRSGGLLDAVCYGTVPVAVAENGSQMCGDVPAPDGPSGTSVARDAGGVFVINKAPSPGTSDVTP
jgi:hypothetical protein